MAEFQVIKSFHGVQMLVPIWMYEPFPTPKFVYFFLQIDSIYLFGEDDDDAADDDDDEDNDYGDDDDDDDDGAELGQ